MLPSGKPVYLFMQIDIEPDLLPATPSGLRIERLGMDHYAELQDLHEAIFDERRVIFRLDRRDLMFLVGYLDDRAVAFKVGYGEDGKTYYSAKGGVLEGYRRQGVARALLFRMEDEAREMGYRRLAFDTFPNRHLGMTVLGLNERYRVTAAGFNAAYQDYRIRFEKVL